MPTRYIEEHRARMTYLIGLKRRTPRTPPVFFFAEAGSGVIDFQERFHLSLYCGASCTRSPRYGSLRFLSSSGNRHFVGVSTATQRFSYRAWYSGNVNRNKRNWFFIALSFFPTDRIFQFKCFYFVNKEALYQGEKSRWDLYYFLRLSSFFLWDIIIILFFLSFDTLNIISLY